MPVKALMTGAARGAGLWLVVAFAAAAMMAPAVLVPRGSLIFLVLLALSAVLGEIARRAGVLPSRTVTWPKTGLKAVVLWGLVFGSFAAASSLWSPDPLSSFLEGLGFIGLMLYGLVSVYGVTRSDPQTLRSMWLGFIGVAAASVPFHVIELVGNQPLRRAFLSWFPSLRPHARQLTLHDGYVTYLSDADLNRVTCVLTLFLGPLLVAALSIKFKLRWICVVALAVLAATIFTVGSHQSSQLAMVGGLLVFAAASWRVVHARRGLQVATVLAIAACVPLSIWAHDYAQLHKSSWLFSSAKSRIVIWNFTAVQVLNAPVLGIGAGATGVLDNQRDPNEIANSEHKSQQLRTSPHAHDVYLQTWYELGAVGAAILIIVILSAFQATSQLAEPEARLWLTQITMILLIAASSYGLWQTWFQAAIISSCVLLWMACLLRRDAAQQ
jgi:O-Antigen ligase